MTGDDGGIQRHRLIGHTDDGIVYAIDVAQCVSFTSLRVTVSNLNAAIEQLDIRLAAANAQILFLNGVIKGLTDANETLRKRMVDESDSRNRSMKWEG